MKTSTAAKPTIAIPNFTIDHKTNEVRIPYDQFHTWMVEVVDQVASIQAILERSEASLDIESIRQRVREMQGGD